MNDTINIHQIYQQEKQRWLRDEAPRRSFRDLLSDSVPHWIIIVAAVLYSLSAPHTASVFDKLTPGWGWIAPVGVEFGLLYAAFRRRYARFASEPLSWTLWLLEILLFLTAMLVNGAGSFTSVISAVNLESLSFAELTLRFGDLPATSQAAILMAALSALIIPIGALVAGEGLAQIVLDRRGGSDIRELRWQEVEFTVTYRALFVQYCQTGLPEREARQQALANVKGYLHVQRPSSVRSLSAGNGQTERANGQIANSAKRRVRDYLVECPEISALSVNEVWHKLREAGIQVGRTTVAEVLKEQRHSIS